MMKDKYEKELVGKIFITKFTNSADYTEYSFHKNHNLRMEEVGLIKWKEIKISSSYTYIDIFKYINNEDWVVINTKNLLIEKSNLKNFGIFKRNNELKRKI